MSLLYACCNNCVITSSLFQGQKCRNLYFLIPSLCLCRNPQVHATNESNKETCRNAIKNIPGHLLLTSRYRCRHFANTCNFFYFLPSNKNMFLERDRKREKSKVNSLLFLANANVGLLKTWRSTRKAREVTSKVLVAERGVGWTFYFSLPSYFSLLTLVFRQIATTHSYCQKILESFSQ